MLQSMTGYSRLVKQTPRGGIAVELRSTNHRYLEVDVRLPEGLTSYEADVTQLVRAQLRRGRVDVTVAIQSPKTGKQIVLDEALAEAYYRALSGLKKRFALKGEITLDVLAHPLLLNAKDGRANQPDLWPVVRQTVQAAIRELAVTRQAEGQRLIRDIRANMQTIAKRAKSIRSALPKSMAQQKHRLGERLRTLMGNGGSLTTGQLHEALALVKDVDVNEELVRLDSHLTHMEQTLKTQQPMGKKLDFISQELMREANTLGAKANDSTIVRFCIEIKGAIEKIREQAQNLE